MLSPVINFDIEHLESRGWYTSTCAGQCNTCAADECPAEMRRHLRDVSMLLPYQEDVDEVRVL